MDLFYDLHIHSCLSPCGDNDMTPYNLVNMAKLKGLDIIALTDHNTCANCPAAVKAGQQAGITVVPGMELCTSEEVHVLCLFGDLQGAMDFSEYTQRRIPKIKNRKDIFGEQLIMDSRDNIIGQFDLLLTTAADISVSEVVVTVGSFGGFCCPAHIDRGSYSLISNLGGINSDMGFTAAELTKRADIAEYFNRFPLLKTMRILRNSDAHFLADISEPEMKISLPECCAKALVAVFCN
ncbi:MAG: PHP domain-containing protein [Clostridiales bacterium]|nr:PHP domain-containing protein [Clostridiales bacterium]